MAETIGPGGQRIKFAARRTGDLQLAASPPPLQELSALMHRLELAGMVPLLNDGLVGGNCAIAAAACCSTSSGTSSGSDRGSECSGSSGLLPSEAAAGAILISRSGKQPGAQLQAADWVLLTRFDPASWAADYWSAGDSARPSSDAPLHAAALGPGAADRYGWATAPLVAVHGHALAQGAALERARQQGLPISDHETLFSTPDDLAALEALFRSHPYPQHGVFIRRGHGFTLLAQSVAEAAECLEQQLLPLL